MKMQLFGKTALVTGASSGIGRALARALARQGVVLAVSARRKAALDSLADEIETAGGKRPVVLTADLSKRGEARLLGERAVTALGRVDILVNNAGVGWFGDVEHTTLDDWHKLLSVNLDGVFLGIKHAIPAMRIAGSGSIINLSSIEGLVGDPALAAYNASKGAVRLLSKSAALYCAKARTNIRVNSVHPGYIWTPMVRHAVESSGHADETRRALEAMHPVGHLGQPQDVAYGVLYLASDESAFVTGTELVIDGGYTAQ